MANQMHAFKKMRPEPETFKAALPSWFIAAVNHVAKLWEERERKLQRLFGSHNSCVCEQWITIAKNCAIFFLHFFFFAKIWQEIKKKHFMKSYGWVIIHKVRQVNPLWEQPPLIMLFSPLFFSPLWCVYILLCVLYLLQATLF